MTEKEATVLRSRIAATVLHAQAAGRASSGKELNSPEATRLAASHATLIRYIQFRVEPTNRTTKTALDFEKRKLRPLRRKLQKAEEIIRRFSVHSDGRHPNSGGPGWVSRKFKRIVTQYLQTCREETDKLKVVDGPKAEGRLIRLRNRGDSQ